MTTAHLPPPLPIHPPCVPHTAGYHHTPGTWYDTLCRNKNRMFRYAALPLARHSHMMCLIRWCPSNRSHVPSCVRRCLTHTSVYNISYACCIDSHRTNVAPLEMQGCTQELYCMVERLFDSLRPSRVNGVVLLCATYKKCLVRGDSPNKAVFQTMHMSCFCSSNCCQTAWTRGKRNRWLLTFLLSCPIPRGAWSH